MQLLDYAVAVTSDYQQHDGCLAVGSRDTAPLLVRDNHSWGHHMGTLRPSKSRALQPTSPPGDPVGLAKRKGPTKIHAGDGKPVEPVMSSFRFPSHFPKSAPPHPHLLPSSPSSLEQWFHHPWLFVVDQQPGGNQGEPGTVGGALGRNEGDAGGSITSLFLLADVAVGPRLAFA